MLAVPFVAGTAVEKADFVVSVAVAVALTISVVVAVVSVLEAIGRCNACDVVGCEEFAVAEKALAADWGGRKSSDSAVPTGNGHSVLVDGQKGWRWW